jgi:hypothetical protein
LGEELALLELVLRMRRWEGSPGFGTEDEACLIQTLEKCQPYQRESKQNLQKPYVKGRLRFCGQVVPVLLVGQRKEEVKTHATSMGRQEGKVRI